MTWQPDQDLMESLTASWLAEKIVACLNHGEEAGRETALCFVDRLCQALRYCLADATIGPEVQCILKENGDPAALISIPLTFSRDHNKDLLWASHPRWNFGSK